MDMMLPARDGQLCMPQFCPTPRKRPYVTAAKAGRAARHSRKALNVYHCRCGMYHLTRRGF